MRATKLGSAGNILRMFSSTAARPLLVVPKTISIAAHTLRLAACGLLGGLAVSCGSTPVVPAAPVPTVPNGASASWRPAARADEIHFGDLRQLTFAGENAEAYWSPSGAELVFQARASDAGCDRIYRINPTAPAPSPIPVSSGDGATTCAFFLPGARELIFASTHLAGPSCPPRPDHSHGYTWAIHPSYDIFRAGLGGQGLRSLTQSPGYDAEATVCSVDGSIVFTSVRDGDLDLYRMDSDGKNVRRLTHEIGYDGGAVFDQDCSHIAWRASRPDVGVARDDYQRLLKQGLVRPNKLELWVADADGTNAHQVTYLDAASFAPTFVPGVPRLVFSSNYGDPKGREFDLWAIDTSGANLERITTAPGFDGFPMFSPDGSRLAFSSNRATAPGSHDTNVFVAQWYEKTVHRIAETPADRILADVRYLAAPEREGRGIGTAGLEAAATYIEARLQRLGLKPAGVRGSYRQPFSVPLRVAVGKETTLTIGGKPVVAADFTPATFSTNAAVKGSLVLAGYGIVDAAAGIDDYAGLNVKGKIVVVRRFAPEHPGLPSGEKQRQAGDIRRKAFVAREHGAVALLVVDTPTPPPAGQDKSGTPWKMPDEAPLPVLRTERYGDAGLPVMFVRRAALSATLARLEKKVPVPAILNVTITAENATAYNIVARVNSELPEAQRLPGVLVVGAHYDHLGMGESHSLEPDSKKAHLGADDNASGTATLIEIARGLVANKARLKRDVVVVAFSGEEEGVLGSTQFTRTPPGYLELSEIVAMINLDMVGRLRDNRVTILGHASAEEWQALLQSACAAAKIECVPSAGNGDGFGPSDQMPFYAANIPVAHFFTGSHPDYHRPSDTADKLNVAGAGQIASAAQSLVEAVAARTARLTLKSAPPSQPGTGDMRSFGASLGSIPDYAGPPEGKPGVLFAGVRAGGAAEAAGLKRGDILTRLGTHPIRSVEDLMYALGASRPSETVDAVVQRGDQQITAKVTFQGPPPKPANSPH